MFKHILVPLDSSSLAECVIPHALAIAQAMDARITLLHVLERPRGTRELPTDPLQWHLKKNEATVYLTAIAARLQETHLAVSQVILEGVSAERIVEYANSGDVDLIALSTHGRSGLSGWNVSSVVQKIILRSNRSTLLVRAYSLPETRLERSYRYQRLFVGLDCSPRAEMVLPVAINLARYYRAKLLLGTVIRTPEIFQRFPLSSDDQGSVDRIVAHNYQAAEHYYQQLSSQFASEDVDLQTFQVASDNIITTLHTLVDKENIDLVILAAHGRSSDYRWPYGSVTTSFIAYGSTSLLIIQDLPGDETQRTHAEIAVWEVKGH